MSLLPFNSNDDLVFYVTASFYSNNIWCFMSVLPFYSNDDLVFYVTASFLQ